MPEALVPIRRALISVSDKTDLVEFARALVGLNVEIISTGGTASTLEAAGISAVPVESVTGFPEIMDGRVKTLHPAIHGALLARRDDPAHERAMQVHGITPIDLVCVNLYPFERTIARPGSSADESIEQIDIGGPAMVRAAAKNHQFVTVVTSPDQYDRVINEMRAHGGATDLTLRRELASAAFSRTAAYDATISAWMSRATPDSFPDVLRLSLSLVRSLRYGENPHQEAAVYRDPASAEPSVVTAQILHGKDLSYNNLNDAAAALDLVQDLDEISNGRAAAAIIKHTNPCGAALGSTVAEAFDRAYEGDPLAAFGGILAVNRPIDEPAAQRIIAGDKFFEVIVAPAPPTPPESPKTSMVPGFDPVALSQIKERWKHVRLLEVNGFRGGLRRSGNRLINYKSIAGGMLVQATDSAAEHVHDWTHVAGPEPDSTVLEDSAFTWLVAKHLKSNAIAIGRGLQILGVGTGQVDRVTACRLAVEKAGARLGKGAHGAVAASDAFFPFPDGPEVLIDGGVQVIVQPGGSKRDQEIIDLCQKRNVTCLLTGIRHFRH